MLSVKPASQNMTPIEIPDVADLPLMAVSRKHLDEHGIVGFESRDPRSRPFNLLRTQVAKRLAANGWTMFGITSATPAAGKSFLSLNLAAALSRVSDQQVYLCDLDLRRGSVKEALGVDIEYGVSDYLAGVVDDPASIAFRIGDGNLAILPTIATAEYGSSELLSGERFGELVSALRRKSGNTIIICDLPPVFANDDSMLTMQHLDAYLLVVDHGTTTRKQLTQTIELLDPAPCLGTVLNRYQGGFADPYGYGYGDTYGLKHYGS